MRVAVTEDHSRVERLADVARDLGQDLNDLEGITAPPTRFDGFLDELSTRRTLRAEVLNLRNRPSSGTVAGRRRLSPTSNGSKRNRGNYLARSESSAA
jgi:hypothetical protein